MNNSLFSFKKSVGILLISIGILTSLYIVSTISGLSFFQGNDISPKDILFTNITDTSFSVTWFTDKPANGKIILISKDNSKKENQDERDTTGTQTYLSHSVPIRQLQPNTQYSVIVISNGKQYLDAEQPFRITTASTIKTVRSNKTPAYGIAMTESKIPSNDTLVFLSTDGSQVLSSLVKNNGSWTIPLIDLRSVDLSTYIQVNENAEFQIRVKTNNKSTSVTADIDSLSPVPAVVVGSNPVEFTTKRQDNTNSITQSRNPPAYISPATIPTGPSITFPTNQAVLSTFLPLIRGTAIPKSAITITLNANKPISSTLLADQFGVWSYSPPSPLSPGKQTVTITSTNTQGKLAAITHSFEILKSGTQVLGEATPSASITPIPPTPTLLLTPTETATPSATPIISLTQTPTPTQIFSTPTILLPQVTPTPTLPIVYPFPPPVTGNPAIPIGLLLLSIFFVTIGIRFL